MSAQASQSQPGKRDANARISFFDPANQALLDRLLFPAEASPSTSATHTNAEAGEGDEDVMWEEEGDTVAATLSNIEEMLEGYEWLGDSLPSRSRKGPADAIESRLLDELGLLERVLCFVSFVRARSNSSQGKYPLLAGIG